MARRKVTPPPAATEIVPAAAAPVTIAPSVLVDLKKLEETRAGLERYAAVVAERTAEIVAELPLYKAITVSNADELATADATLTTLVRWKDDTLAMRTNATGPLYKIVKLVEAWFRPLVQATNEAETHLKAQIGAFKVQLFEAQQAANRAAVVAAQSNDRETVVEALNASTAIATASETHAGTRMRWAVKRINPDLLPDEYWCPDTAKIEAVFAAADGNGDAPVIPGVIPERVAAITAKR